MIQYPLKHLPAMKMCITCASRYHLSGGRAEDRLTFEEMIKTTISTYFHYSHISISPRSSWILLNTFRSNPKLRALNLGLPNRLDNALSISFEVQSPLVQRTCRYRHEPSHSRDFEDEDTEDLGTPVSRI